ncbi:MAG TPA: ABC transporter ATP-binding protein [Candidatus Competibacteraceae bacterium]|nr:ABC transporter ATP-binding protein [Candidatus Competibacteraceae bacterium]
MIELSGVTRVFQVGEQRVHGLRQVDLSIAAGEYVAVMGPSGSGKSTLLHIIGLLDRPDAGTYRLEGRDTGALDDEALAALRRERIGFVFQAFHLVPRLSAAENVELPLMLAGVAPVQRRRRVAEALQALGLAERADHRPDQLSGGQRQRVAIARAMILHPRVLLADEPTGNLDRQSGREVLAILEELNSQGITLIVVTHNPEIGERARRCLRLVDGRIVSDTGERGHAPA